MAKTAPHVWTFKSRFRRRAFGWKSQPAIARVRQAVAEIKKVAKKEPVLAAEGAVAFLERVSPALEHVDGSSGAIGQAVYYAIRELVSIIAGAPADAKTRHAWLERLFDAHAADDIPYIEGLAEHWGELCASKEVAAQWADRLIDITRLALSPDKNTRGHFHGTTACLSAMLRAERYREIIDLVGGETLWHHTEWAVRAMVASGQKAEALRYAESCRNPWANDLAIDAVCEEILLSSGLHEEAYTRYGVRPNLGGTFAATFRAVTKKYPHRPPRDVLADLVRASPGHEGRWFAAAKDAELYDDALTLARKSPCDPKTLTRAARDFVEDRPQFAVEAGLLALHWLLQGYGYEITSIDVWSAYRSTLAAAAQCGNGGEVLMRIRAMVAAEPQGERFVNKVLARELGL